MHIALVAVCVLVVVPLYWFPVTVLTSVAVGSLLWKLFSKYRTDLDSEVAKINTEVQMRMNSSGRILESLADSTDNVSRKSFPTVDYNLSPRSFGDVRSDSQVRLSRRRTDLYTSSLSPSSRSSSQSKLFDNTFVSPSVSILSRSNSGVGDRTPDRRMTSPSLPPGSYPWIAPFNDSSAEKLITDERVPVKMRLSKPFWGFQHSPGLATEEPREPESTKQIIQALKELSRKRTHTTESEDDSQENANVPKRRMDVYHNLSASQLGSTSASLETSPESQENCSMETSQREPNGTENHVQPNHQVSNKRPRASNDNGGQMSKKRNYTNEILCSLSSSVGLLDPKLLQNSPKNVPHKRRQRVRETSCAEVQTLPSPAVKEVKDKQDKGTGTEKIDDAPAINVRPEITVKKVEGSRAQALLMSALMKFQNSGDLIPATSSAVLKSTSEAVIAPSTGAVETKSTFTFSQPATTVAAPVVSDAMSLGTPSPTGDNSAFPAVECPPTSGAQGFKFGSSETTLSVPAPVVASAPLPDAKVPDTSKDGELAVKQPVTHATTQPSQNGTSAPQGNAPAASGIFSFSNNAPTTQVAAPAVPSSTVVSPTASAASGSPAKPGGFSFAPSGTFSFGSSKTTAVATTTQSTPTFTFGGSTGATKTDAGSLFGMPQPPTTAATTKPEPSKLFGSTAGGFNFSASAPTVTKSSALSSTSTPKTNDTKPISGSFGANEANKPFTFGSANTSNESNKASYTFGSIVAAGASGGTSKSATFGTSTTAAPTFGTPTTAASTFGTPTTTTPTFGTPTTAAPTFGSTGNAPLSFGSLTSSASTFGSATSAAPTFGSSAIAPPSFGSGSGSTAAPTFGSSTTPAQFNANASAFPATTKSAGFGSNSNSFSASSTGTFAFGKPAEPAGSSLFGSTGPTTATPSTVFGSTNTATTGFGSVSTAPLTFGTTSTATGFGATASAVSTPSFGSLSSAAPAFGTASSPFNSASTFGSAPTVFGATGQTFGSAPAAATPAPAFGSTSTPAPSFGSGGFGSTPSFGSTATPTFGSTTPGFTASQTQPAAPFNFSAPAASGGFNFSAPQPSAKPMFQFGASSAAQTAAPGATPFAFGGAPGVAPVAAGGFQNTMFSIGSGSSAPRSRTTQRARKK